MLAATIAALLGGLVIGSFLNVVAWRLPRGESLAHPPSHCPECGAAIKPYDNIPVLSWLLLRGKCRSCGVAISPRYPLVELGTGLLWAAVVVARYPDGSDVALGILLVTFLVPIALIDLAHRLIPNKLTLPMAVLGLVVILALDRDFLVEALIAAAAAGGFFLVAVMGLYLGRAVAPAVFIALISGVAVGATIIARKGAKEGRKTAVPFGPFLALGAVIALFAGDALVDAYVKTF
jgi:leader peptidase (prepilin peptidase)/N-methyltransferase